MMDLRGKPVAGMKSKYYQYSDFTLSVTGNVLTRGWFSVYLLDISTFKARLEVTDSA